MLSDRVLVAGNNSTCTTSKYILDLHVVSHDVGYLQENTDGTKNIKDAFGQIILCARMAYENTFCVP